MTTPPSLTSLANIATLLASLPGPDSASLTAAHAREPQLTKPAGSLGRLEELAAFVAGWQGQHPPTLVSARCVVFAGNHGVAARGVSAFPAAVTAQMVANFQHGGAAINQLCRANGIELTVIPLDLDRPTADFTQQPAMGEGEFMTAFNIGLHEGLKPTDVLCLGEMGIANSTSAAALCLALYQGIASDWVGPGTGVVGEALASKTKVVTEGVGMHAIHRGNPLELLRCVGGRELAAIAGAVVGARLARIPVMLDGFICTAAAAALEATQPGSLDHCLVAHQSREPGHRRLARLLGKIPLLDFNLRLGEASGAALAIPILRAAVACHAGMATFGEAGVSDKG